MNVRLTLALVLIVFMIPVGHVIFSLPLEPIELRAYGHLFGFMGYVVWVAYLIATGYNQLNKGKPL
jgi:membrane associated rhomboid family serine protease